MKKTGIKEHILPEFEDEDRFGALLGERIRRKRRAQKITRVTLAEAIGVQDQTLAKYESGENSPTAKVLAKIARSLGVSVDFLMFGNVLEREMSGEQDEAIAMLHAARLLLRTQGLYFDKEKRIRLVPPLANFLRDYVHLWNDLSTFDPKDPKELIRIYRDELGALNLLKGKPGGSMEQALSASRKEKAICGVLYKAAKEAEERQDD